MNYSDSTTFVAVKTSQFDIPCSIFDIKSARKEAKRLRLISATFLCCTPPLCNQVHKAVEFALVHLVMPLLLFILKGFVMIDIEYLTDKSGKTKAVVIPIDVWKKIVPSEDASINELSENMEEYCLNKAMDEAKKSPLLNREEALKFLKE
jgi:hypothetical protein